jgi:hypothetical protein
VSLPGVAGLGAERDAAPRRLTLLVLKSKEKLSTQLSGSFQVDCCGAQPPLAPTERPANRAQSPANAWPALNAKLLHDTPEAEQSLGSQARDGGETQARP